MIVNYQINGGSIISDTLTDTISAGSSFVHTFSVPADYSLTGTYDLIAWVVFSGDLNIYNDTSSASTTVVAGVIQTLPFFDNFDAYQLCSTASDCEATVCPFGGWVNQENLVIDDIDFRVNTAGTPTAGSGPTSDHTSGSGQYIYLEASLCFNKNAELLSPCIDLTTNTGPQLSFWYHMFGTTMGVLHVDVYANDVWNDDVMAPLSGNFGDLWRQAVIDLDAFAGQIITIRFRSSTGNGSSSDIAIDDVNIIETDVAPVPAFAAFTSVCAGSTLTLTDNSTFSPTSWQWNITPSTFTFENGTSAASQNPQLMFSATGTYDVQLIASNQFGTDTLSIAQYINVVTPSSITLTEDFQGTFTPVGWRIESSGNPVTWAQAFNITGKSGNFTNAAYMNNYDQVGGVQDGLARIQVDLGAALTPKMTFDLAHARLNTSNDGLRVEVSTDCGDTWVPSGYFKQGAQLATAAATPAPFIPVAGSQWRTDTVNLATWVGQIISLRFLNLSASGNNLYIDNVNIADITGINEPALNASVNIFPNPSADGVFNLTIEGLKNTDAVFTVTDVQGKQVEQRSAIIGAAYNCNFDLSKKSKGVYFLEIRTQDGVSRYKLSVI
jgi:PKD repeat protein